MMHTPPIAYTHLRSLILPRLSHSCVNMSAIHQIEISLTVGMPQNILISLHVVSLFIDYAYILAQAYLLAIYRCEPTAYSRPHSVDSSSSTNSYHYDSRRTMRLSYKHSAIFRGCCPSASAQFKVQCYVLKLNQRLCASA